jgi:hypothetical protein
MPGSTPYIVAGGAILATWAIDHWDELMPSAPSVPRRPAMSTALERVGSPAMLLPCQVRRLDHVITLTGAPIRQMASGVGEDFLREAHIQTASLSAALGSLLPAIKRPKLTARCAAQWIERWLDAWQLANQSDPQAFHVEQKATSAPDTSSVGGFLLDTVGPWTFGIVGGVASILASDPLPGHDTYDRVGPWRTAATPSRLSALGRTWEKLRQLHREAQSMIAVANIADIFGGIFGQEVAAAGEPVWVGARRTTETIFAFAGQLDTVGFQHPSVKAEAVAQLKRDLHPARFAEKAVDVVVTPVEFAIEKVVGPTLAATLGALATSLLPWLVVGGAVYYLARRAT